MSTSPHLCLLWRPHRSSKLGILMWARCHLAVKFEPRTHEKVQLLLFHRCPHVLYPCTSKCQHRNDIRGKEHALSTFTMCTMVYLSLMSSTTRPMILFTRSGVVFTETSLKTVCVAAMFVGRAVVLSVCSTQLIRISICSKTVHLPKCA